MKTYRTISFLTAFISFLWLFLENKQEIFDYFLLFSNLINLFILAMLYSYIHLSSLGEQKSLNYD